MSAASDGEGVGGESRELFLAQLGIDVTSGPGDVAVVGGGKGDAAIGIAITPSDGTGGIELSSAISFCEGSGARDVADYRPVIGAGDSDGDGGF